MGIRRLDSWAYGYTGRVPMKDRHRKPRRHHKEHIWTIHWGGSAWPSIQQDPTEAHQEQASSYKRHTKCCSWAGFLHLFQRMVRVMTWYLYLSELPLWDKESPIIGQLHRASRPALPEIWACFLETLADIPTVLKKSTNERSYKCLFSVPLKVRCIFGKVYWYTPIIPALMEEGARPALVTVKPCPHIINK